MATVIVIGVILVIITGVLALIGQAFWTLPATVAISTVLLAVLVNHGIPWWAVLLIVLALVGVAIATIASPSALIVMALGVVTLGVIMALVLFSGPKAPEVAQTAKPTATATATPTATPTTASCDAQFVQVSANNTDGKVDGDFEAKYAAATTGAANLSDAQKQLLLKESANNAQRLAIWSNAFGLYANPNNWQPLVEGNCLSPAGRDLYNQFAGALNAKGTTFAEDNAPANGYNSGVNSGTYQVAGSSGITGNRKAIKVTHTDGTVSWIMVRCGNVVFSTPPVGVPTTPPTPTPTPTPPCPPGQVMNVNNVCVTSKSSSPKDYRQPGDSGKGADVGTGTKPPVVAAPTGETTPPPVATGQTGGNGAVDSSTAPLGSQSGLAAPGAAPAPTTTSTPPPNEGGSNSGVVSGF